MYALIFAMTKMKTKFLNNGLILANIHRLVP